MKKKDFMKFFPGNVIFSAFDYQKKLPPIDHILVRKNQFYKKQTYLNKLNKEDKRCIYFAPNLMQGDHRGKDDTVRVRAVWVDDDNPRSTPRKDFPLKPSLIVRTSPGKYHYYWLTDTENFDEFDRVMETLTEEYGNDPKVKHRAALLRFCNFYHMKDPDKPYKVSLVGGTKRTYPWELVRAKFPPVSKKGKVKKEKFSKKKSRKNIKTGEDYHGSLRDLAMSYANNGLSADEIVVLLKSYMNDVPRSKRDKRWQDRVEEHHLYECASSAVKKVEKEEFEIADDKNVEQVFAKKLSNDIICPPGLIGSLTMKIYNSWWVPNIMVAGLAARSLIAYLAGGKYAGDQGDRVNIQQVAVGETGSGKDAMFNSILDIIAQMYPDEEQFNEVSKTVVEEIASYEGMDDILRNAKKQDLLWMQDEIGGLLMRAKKESRFQSIFEYLLKMYSKADKQVSVRAKANSSSNKSEKAKSKILYAPNIIVSGATTPDLLASGIDNTFITFGNAPRMMLFPVGQYAEEPVRRIKRVKINENEINILRKIREEKDEGMNLKYPYCRIKGGVKVRFEKSAAELSFSQRKKNSKFTGLKLNVYNRQVANAKKYAMIEAIANNPVDPVVDGDMMFRALIFVAHACEYSMFLFDHEVTRMQVANSDEEKAAVKIVELVKKNSADGKATVYSAISRLYSFKKLQIHSRAKILEELEKARIIEKIEKKNPRGRPTTSYIYIDKASKK